jgi:hypothetical protein
MEDEKVQRSVVHRNGRYVRHRQPARFQDREQIFGVRCGITSGAQAALVTLGYSDASSASGSCWTGSVGRAESGLLRAPQIPHKSATRRPVPTGIPQTKRHTPVHLLRVLKARKTPRQQRRWRELGCWSLFQVTALRMTELLKRGRSRPLAAKLAADPDHATAPSSRHIR